MGCCLVAVTDCIDFIIVAIDLDDGFATFEVIDEDGVAVSASYNLCTIAGETNRKDLEKFVSGTIGRLIKR